MAAPDGTANQTGSADRLTRVIARIYGHRTKWLLLVLWVAVLAAIGPVANKLFDSTNDQAVAWLARSAESTVVDRLQIRFPSRDTSLAVAVYVRDSGLTDADREAVARAAARLGGYAEGGQIAPPTQAPDGKAMALLIAMPTQADGHVPSDQVKRLREGARAYLPTGLDVRTTGPASAAADVGDAFAGLDTTLLLVSIAVVAVMLLLTYRSPVLWLLPLIAVGVASQLASAVVYLLATHAGLVVNSQNAGILTVLVFGAGTDYALLLISRYREELHRHADRHHAMAVALRRAGPAVVASAATVATGLLCLFAAQLNSNRGLGPVGALGIVAAVLSMTLLLPVLLLAFGRWVFWPFVPRVGTPERDGRGPWAAVGSRIARRPQAVWIGTVLVLAALSIGISGMPIGLTAAQTYTTRPESVAGQELLAAHFPAGSAEPAQVISTASGAGQVAAAARDVPGVSSVSQPVLSTDGALAQTEVVLAYPPDTSAAEDTVLRLRDAVHKVPGADARVGGVTATNRDTATANSHDRLVVIPLVLAVVLLVLILLLRSLVAPLLLIATVLLSLGSALGVGWLLFDHVFGFGGVDQSLILLGFLFLVALGVDYNIFLITRSQEEVTRLGHRSGIQRGLALTGGVITSAGLVLAATFAVLNVLPLVATAELGILVGIGVLLDTLVVRPILVPALAMDIGRRFWWPGRLSRTLPGDSDGSGRSPASQESQPNATLP
jgi:RND superfamily putative drug exporter